MSPTSPRCGVWRLRAFFRIGQEPFHAAAGGAGEGRGGAIGPIEVEEGHPGGVELGAAFHEVVMLAMRAGDRNVGDRVSLALGGVTMDWMPLAREAKKLAMRRARGWSEVT